jgi:hypothetical protein
MLLKPFLPALLAAGAFTLAVHAQTPATLPNLSTTYTQAVVNSYSQTCDGSGCHNQTGDRLIAALSNTGDADTKIDDSGNVLFNAGLADSNGATYGTGLWLLRPDGTSFSFSDTYPAYACSQPNSNTATISGSSLLRVYFNPVLKAYFAVTQSDQTTYNFAKSNSGVCTTQSVNGTYTITTNTTFALVRIDKVPPPQ